MKTAIECNVSYKQVYSWVRKYKNLGVEGLQYKRSKRNLKNDLPLEKLMDLTLKKLETENDRLCVENLLKKNWHS
ncbi:hypothetical protein SH2C18_45060 [Clostridium sediminicola]|uniref:helix-turn-helix domain-containing protein n=1 Tax=Clostridium sediminicola TaxID=3114879 RepID=UPI0031F271B9